MLCSREFVDFEFCRLEHCVWSGYVLDGAVWLLQLSRTCLCHAEGQFADSQPDAANCSQRNDAVLLVDAVGANLEPIVARCGSIGFHAANGTRPIHRSVERKKKRTLCIVFIIGLRIVFASDRHFCCCCYCLPCGNFDVSVSGARVRVARGLFASRNASISSPWRCLEIFCCVRVGHNDFGIVDNPSDGRL